MVTIGEEFPDFMMQTCEKNNTLGYISNLDITDEWAVMFFYPKDFTFICPTEIDAFNSLVNEAKVVGVSGDNEFCKLAWKENNPLISDIEYPLAADSGLPLGTELGIVDDENGVHYRATYIIDPNGIVQHVSVNALDTGRNADEVLRTLQALKAGGLTGCEWQPGDNFVG